MPSELMASLSDLTGIVKEELEESSEILERSFGFIRSSFDVQTHILRELVVRAKSFSQQDPQEALSTFRQLFCILNNEDASRLRGAVISLIELGKIQAEKEMSYKKLLRLSDLWVELRSLSLFLPIIFSHYQEAIRKTSFLHPWGQSDRARTLREQMNVLASFE